MINKLVMQSSIRIKLLMFFLPLIVLSVLLTGFISYLLAKHQLDKNAYSLLNDAIKQTDVYLDDKLSTMFEQIFSIENDSSFQSLILDTHSSNMQSDKYSEIMNINEKLNDIYMRYYQIVDSAYIYFNNGTEFNLLKSSVPVHIGIDLDQWLEKYQGNVNEYYWLNNHEDDVLATVDKRNVLTVFKITGNNTSEIKGILLLNLKSDYFLKILQNVNISPNGYIVMVSQDGIMSSKKQNEKYALGDVGTAFLRENMGNSGSFNMTKANGRKLFVVFNSIKINKWIVAAVVPEKDVFQNSTQIKYMIIAIVIFLTVIVSIVATLFSGSISKSIRYLSKQVKRFEKGDFNVEFNIEDHNEIGILAKGLSSLLNTVKILLIRIKDEQEKKRQIELLALQSQINPHFLYNSLNSIKQLIKMKDNQRADKMVSSLIKFYMIGISKGKEIITINEEIEHAMNYLVIQKMRYNKDFDFSFAMSDEIRNCKIIKLTLQPIIENAIYHGIKNKEDLGIICVKGWQQDQDIIIEVYDDGAGIDPERLEQLKNSINLPDVEENPITYGLRNVNLRIKLHYGATYGIAIESEKGCFTKVKIRIPVIF